MRYGRNKAALIRNTIELIEQEKERIEQSIILSRIETIIERG